MYRLAWIVCLILRRRVNSDGTARSGYLPMSDKLQNTHAEKGPSLRQATNHASSEPFHLTSPSEKNQTEKLAPSSPVVSAPGGPFPFRFRDQILLGVACAIALLFMAIYCVRISHWGADPIELERQPQHVLDYKIDLNSATWVEWSQLRGIGPVLAKRIVDEREQNGPFRSIDDLDRVKGIGPIKIESIRPFVRTDSANGPTEPVSDVLEQVDSIKSP